MYVTISYATVMSILNKNKINKFPNAHSKFHDNPSNSCRDISVLTLAQEQPTTIWVVLLAWLKVNIADYNPKILNYETHFDSSSSESMTVLSLEQN